MASLDTIYAKLFKWEGGYVNDKDDRGGKTYKGVTRGVYDVHCAAVLKRQPTDAHFRSLTDEEVKAFFRVLYWDEVKGDEIDSLAVACMIADFGWGSGTGTAAACVQRTINKHFGGSLSVDGAIGPVSLKAINALPAVDMLRALTLERMMFLNRIVRNDRTQGKFLHGWMNRMEDTFYALLDMALDEEKSKTSTRKKKADGEGA